jgi:hypothetical protein
MNRASWILGTLLLAGCQSQAHRLLLIDLTLADPAQVDAIAKPWHDAGYTVEYRRFFPHLARHDLLRYRGVVVLGGRRPDAPSDALTTGDAALLLEWVRTGGVVILGYPGAESGSLDRWTMNRWLLALGTGLAIDDAPLAEPSSHGTALAVIPVRATLPEANMTPVGLGRNHLIHLAAPTQALARTAHGAAVIGASRVGAGLVIVASRAALSALGAEPGGDLPAPSDLLEALARWTRRPAEWAAIPAARRPRPLLLEGGPEPLASIAPQLNAPRGAPLLDLPLRERSAEMVPLPDWATRQGLRILWAGTPSLRALSASRTRSLDSLGSVLDGGGFNVVAGPAHAEAMAESTHYAPWERTVTQTLWRVVTDRLDQTSARWIPALEPDSFRIPLDTMAGGQCLLDPSYWNAAIVPGMLTLARLSAAHPDLIPGVALDLGDLASGTEPPHLPCEADYRIGLDAMARDSVISSGFAATLARVEPAARYRTLVEDGLLDDLYAALERVTATRAASIHAAAMRIRPGLLFAIRAAAPPTDWFGRGLLRGWSARGLPVILLGGPGRTREIVAGYRAEGILVLSALELDPERIATGAWSRLRHPVFEENDGFWMEASRPLLVSAQVGDSLGRLIRRLSR